MNELLGLIRSLKQNEDAWPFLAPVDWKAMELLVSTCLLCHLGLPNSDQSSDGLVHSREECESWRLLHLS